MGNTNSSKDRAGEDTVDFGYLTPQGGLYPSAAQDWNHTVVTQLIVHRKLAPFYRPLEDYREDWDNEQILASQKRPSLQDGASASDDASASGNHAATISAAAAATVGAGGGSASGPMTPPPSASFSHTPHLQSATSALRHAAGKSGSRSSQANKEPQRNLEAQVYRGAVDCPICFLVSVFNSSLFMLIARREMKYQSIVVYDRLLSYDDYIALVSCGSLLI